MSHYGQHTRRNAFWSWAVLGVVGLGILAAMWLMLDASWCGRCP
jgi:hypothetical protein